MVGLQYQQMVLELQVGLKGGGGYVLYTVQPLGWDSSGVVQPSESGMCFVCGGQGQRIRTKDTLVTFACAKTAAKLLEVVVCRG